MTFIFDSIKIIEAYIDIENGALSIEQLLKSKVVLIFSAPGVSITVIVRAMSSQGLKSSRLKGNQNHCEPPASHLATLISLHFTPVSKFLGRSVGVSFQLP